MDHTRIAGTGHELIVYRTDDGDYFLALPVSSSIVTDSFRFLISKQQAERLRDDAGLRKRLDKRLHRMLQGRITRGQKSATDEECIEVIEEFTSE